MRHIKITPETADVPYTRVELDYIFILIENDYEEDWRVRQNGDMVLEVDNDFLHRLADDNWAVFENFFRAKNEHNEETRKYEWADLPEHLQGEYIIKGVYKGFDFVNGPREYYFVQEGA